jgi:hypothetical protein
VICHCVLAVFTGDFSIVPWLCSQYVKIYGFFFFFFFEIIIKTLSLTFEDTHVTDATKTFFSS